MRIVRQDIGHVMTSASPYPWANRLASKHGCFPCLDWASDIFLSNLNCHIIQVIGEDFFSSKKWAQAVERDAWTCPLTDLAPLSHHGRTCSKANRPWSSGGFSFRRLFQDPALDNLFSSRRLIVRPGRYDGQVMSDASWFIFFQLSAQSLSQGSRASIF